MKFEVPEQLQATRDRLIHSLPSHPQEVAPPVPQRLMEDFSERFAPAPAAPAAAERAESGLVDKVRRFFASPAFGLAAAAMLVLGLLVPQLVDRSQDGPETFRAAGDTPATEYVSRIVFIASFLTSKAICPSSWFKYSGGSGGLAPRPPAQPKAAARASSHTAQSRA